MNAIRLWFMPNRVLGSTAFRIMVLFQVVLFLVIWSASNFPFLPTPLEIGAAWMKLMREGLGYELATSLMLTFEATALTLLVSLALIYASVMPFFRPFTALFSKFRFNGLVGLTLFFTVLTSSGHELKVSLLVFSMSVWFVTSMAEVVGSIPQAEYEHARTLRMKEWRVVWEVLILGKLDAVVEVLRQNTAISWLMLTTVEGMVRTEGGIGAVLTVQSKYLHVSEVLAIQLTILVVGLALDWLWGFAHRMFFPYASLATERR